MNKVVLITGATGGLGSAIFDLMKNKNYKVCICGRNEELLKNLTKGCDVENIIYEAFDITDYKKTKLFVDKVITKFGKIDILINNAGANTKRDNVVDIEIDDLKEMMDINVFSHLNLIKLAYPSLKKNKGHIVEILSTVCLYENTGIASYSASKCAMESISKTLLKEVLEDDVKVTNVYPGGINTGFRTYENKDYMNPETVAKAIVNCIELPSDATIHELVLRPKIEKNY